MSKLLSPESVYNGLLAAGTTPDRAAAMVKAKFGAEVGASVAFVQPVGAELSFPIRMTLPWSSLCSDNEREKASAMRSATGEIIPRKVLGARYKTAMGKTRDKGREVMGAFRPLARPLGITAMVYVPDERPHDVCNFAKCCHDALQKVVYTNDGWLHDTHWIRAGVDVDAPRAEIDIRAL